jgi:PAS domain S-box-containing protein
MATDSATTAIRFPIRLLTVALVLTTVTIVWFGWAVFDARRDARRFRDESLRIEELRGVIVHLDEVLTMSARMAAATGDPKWEERYRRFERQLDAAIKETTTLGATLHDLKASTMTDQANSKLVEMENRAFVLVRAGLQEQAQAVLFNPDYEAQKKIYAQGIESFRRQIGRQADERERRDRRINFLSMLGALVVLAVSVAAWLSVVRGLQRWRAELEQALSERQQAEHALRRAHGALEVRVVERTAELAKANAALQAENTERKRAEESLRLLSSAVEQAKESILITDAELDLPGPRILFVNPAFTRMTGYSAEEAMGKTPRILQGPRTDKTVLSRLRQNLDRGEGFEGEAINYRKDGTEFILEWQIAPIRNGSGKITHFVSIQRDITERKQMELASIRLAAIVESSDEAIIGKDLNSIITSWNEGAEKIFGYSAAEIIGTSIMRLIPADRQDEENQVLGRIKRGENVGHFETVRQTKAGALIHISVTASPIKDVAGKVIGVSKVAHDITERKRAEESLREKEHLLSESQRLGHIGSWLYDLAGPMSWSEETYHLFGVSPDTFTPTVEALLSLIHPDDRPAMQAWFAACAAGEKPGELDFRIDRPDGTIHFLRGRGEAVQDVHHKLSHMAGTAQDITERKNAESALRQSHERMRLQTAALEAAANGVVITDLHGTIQWINPAFTQLTGYSAAEIIGQNPRVLKSGHHPDSFYKEIWQTISSAQVWKGELINRRKNGQLYHEEMTITPVCDASGDATHFIAIKQDITERKRAEEELRWKTALLEAQVHSSLDGILVVDEQSSQVIKNQRFDEVWKIPRPIADDPDDQKSLQFATSQTKHPQQFIENIAYLYSHPEKISRDEIELLDGTVLDRYSSPIRDKDGKYYGRIWTFRDITERKRAEASLQDLHRQLLDASREAGMAEVATNVLHNVGNVLNSVNVSASLVADRVKKSKISSLVKVVSLLRQHEHDLGVFIIADPKGKRLPAYLALLSEHLLADQKTNVQELDSLRENIDHIKEIVAMQQRYAMAAGVPELLDLTALVEDSLRLNRDALSRHHVDLVREFEKVPPMYVEKHKVLQILVNLLRNARHACDKSARPDKRLTVRVADGEGRVRISVMDNGIGIPPENLTRIFNQGFTTKKDGHGFGLHSGALAATEMGGSLIVHSDGPGEGATFTLELPLEAPGRNDQMKKAVHPDGVRDAGGEFLPKPHTPATLAYKAVL